MPSYGIETRESIAQFGLMWGAPAVVDLWVAPSRGHFESVCGKSVFCVCSACFWRFVATLLCLFRYFGALLSYIGLCFDEFVFVLFVQRLDAFLAACCVCV